MLPGFCNDVVTVVRAPLGGGVRRERLWDDAQRHEIAGCTIQASTTDGAVGERENASETVVAYFNPGADIQAGDRIEFMGKAYSMIGEPMLHHSPLGACDNVMATFRRWHG